MVAISSPTQSPDQHIIDRIVYLGSLASDRRAIDPLLDTLRAITANWRPDTPLRPAQRQSLEQLEAKLKHFLLHEDPVRAFTETSLAARLTQSQQAQTQPRRVIPAQSFWIISLVAIGISALPLALPPYPIDFATRTGLILPIFYIALSLGVGWFYLTALRNFKAEFRRGFTWLCVGIVLFSLATAQFFFIEIYHLGHNPLFRYGGFMLPTPIAFALMYSGLYAHTRALKLFASRWLFVGTLVAVAAIVWVVPHPVAVTHEVYYRMSLMSVALATVIAAFTTALTYRIMRATTAGYAAAMSWLLAFVAGSTLGGIGFFLALYFIAELNGPGLSRVLTLAVAPEFLLLYAGYVFKRNTNR